MLPATVEIRRTLLRAANGGVTAIVLPDGAAALATDGQTSGTEIRRVPRLRLRTFYTRWGDAFACTCLAAIAIVLLRPRSRALTRRRRQG